MKIAHGRGLRFRQILLSAQIATLLVLAPSTSFARESFPSSVVDYVAVGFDAFVLRPLGAVRLAIGSVALIPTSILYVIKLPLDGDTANLQDVADILVVQPANFIFRRPLGQDLGGE